MNAEPIQPHTAGATAPPLPLPQTPTQVRALMSDLCDGEAAASAAACAAWAQDAQARQAWHEYHLIGDVLRSEDLALRPQRDAAFLAALRTRLAQEPVPLAPVPLPALARPSPARAAAVLGWRAPMAVAAGFAAVAVVLGLVRPGAGAGGAADEVMAGSGLGSRSTTNGTVLISNPAGSGMGTGGGLGSGTRPAAVPGAVAGVGFVVAPDSLMIRNPQLDAHLRAHQTARLRAAAEPSASSLRDSPILIPPDLVAAHVFKRVPPSRVGLSNTEAGP